MMNPFGNFAAGPSPFAANFEEFLGALRGEAPRVRECSSKADLALWFKSFAAACRAALPRDGQ